VVLEANGGDMLDLPAAACEVFIVAALSVFLFHALRLLGRRKNGRQPIAFSFWLILPFMVVGAAEQIWFPCSGSRCRRFPLLPEAMAEIWGWIDP